MQWAKTNTFQKKKLNYRVFVFSFLQKKNVKNDIKLRYF